MTLEVIAGGHSLIPVMKQRLTDISQLIDLAGVDALKGISIDGDTVTIGAMTTRRGTDYKRHSA